jgi:lipopolysaccharide/colanic/teichoic acid biosynthesis glycosyltransferase
MPEAPRAKRFGLYRHGVKRIIDIAAVIVAAPFLVPLLFLIGVVVASDGHSPFFRQDRVGLNGKPFRIWKFRTMVPNAEALLDRHLDSHADARAEWDTKQKLTNDPRITDVGRILRRTSIDELPQVLNVLLGDMSLVGPRPMMPSQQAMYPGHAYFRLRPGMTGSWQVWARNGSTFAERATFDDQYEQDFGLATDLAILGKTIGVVCRGTGL